LATNRNKHLKTNNLECFLFSEKCNRFVITPNRH
jgi:hypothetical protein